MIKKEKITINNSHLAKTLGVKAGDTIDVEFKNGVAVGREWRNRLKDAEVDGCVALHQNTKKASKPEPKEEAN